MLDDHEGQVGNVGFEHSVSEGKAHVVSDAAIHQLVGARVFRNNPVQVDSVGVLWACKVGIQVHDYFITGLLREIALRVPRLHRLHHRFREVARDQSGALSMQEALCKGLRMESRAAANFDDWTCLEGQVGELGTCDNIGEFVALETCVPFGIPVPFGARSVTVRRIVLLLYGEV